ncbi:hypothetical protein [Kitasatospora sp. NPDC058218]|uniref:hypothetical protein n=1 Tax=Kitasatospora sp. NPDC058218 TaxID=3346385 RepID=UPI0036DEB8ED
MDGAWRITVIGKDAAFDQRVVVRTPYGAAVLPGRVGASLDVPAQEWELHLEHHAPGLGWRPNVRVLPGPLQESDGGLRTRVVRSKDVDWADGDPAERNFTLRLVCLEAGAPQEEPVQAPIPAATPVARTSSDPHLGTSALTGTDRRGYRTGSEAEREVERGGAGTAPAGWEHGTAAHAAPGTGRVPARWEDAPLTPLRHERGPVAPAGPGAGQAPAQPRPGRVPAGPEQAASTDARWQSLPPVPEGWERVPVPPSELGPGMVPAIRRKEGQERSLGQRATRAVPARWRADQDGSVEQDAVQEVLAGREASGGAPGGRKALRNVAPWPEAVREEPGREASAERAVPAVWNTGPEPAGGQEVSRAVPAGYEAVRGVPAGREWEAPAARRTVQGGPAEGASRGTYAGQEAVRALPVTGRAAAAEAPVTGREAVRAVPAQEAAAGEAPGGHPARPW